MDLTHNDEQIALRDSAERFLKERYSAAMRAEPGSAWTSFADLGWLGLPLPETHNGAGGSIVDVALLAEAMGRNLVVEPYVSAVLLCGGLIAACGSEGQKGMWLPHIIDSSTRLTLALEDAGDVLAGMPATTAEVGRDIHLSGRKTAVLDAGTAAHGFLVTATSPGLGTGVYHVARDAPGLAVRAHASVDGRTAATLVLERVPGERLGGPNDRSGEIVGVVDGAVAALCSDMVGAMQAALDATVAYAKVRKQFGQPIGANQVVKHRLVEMAIRCEEARSSALLAAIRCSDGSDATTRARAVSSAKVKIAKAARAVTEDAVQLHGAMGVTEELEVGGYLKRGLAFEAVLGTVKQHRARYAAASGTAQAA